MSAPPPVFSGGVPTGVESPAAAHALALPRPPPMARNGEVQVVISKVNPPTDAPRRQRCGRTAVLGRCCCALVALVLVWGAFLGAGIYELVTFTTIELRSVEVSPSARAADKAIDISVDATVASFPAAFSILLDSARCAVGRGEEGEESLSLELDTTALLVASDHSHFSPTATLAVESVAALRAHLASWRAAARGPGGQSAPHIECRGVAKLGVLGVPARLPLAIDLIVHDTVASAGGEDGGFLSFDGVSFGAGAFQLAARASFPMHTVLPPPIASAPSPVHAGLNAFPLVSLNTTGASASLQRDADGVG